MNSILKAAKVLTLVGLSLTGFPHERGSGWGNVALADDSILDPVEMISELFASSVGKVVHSEFNREIDFVSTANPQDTEVKSKDDDARTILVVGDKLAKGLYEGLMAAFAQTAGIRVESLILENYGLTQFQVPSLPIQLRNEISETDPSIVVIFIGTRDQRSIEDIGGRIKFNTKAWENSYRYKVAQMVAEVLNSNSLLLWVGLAPTPSEILSKDFVKFNEIYQSETELQGGRYLDIWFHFLGPNGEYTANGINYFGFQSELRGPQGIYFSEDGYRKLAYFVESQIFDAIGVFETGSLVNNSNDPNYLLLTGINPIQVDVESANGGNSLSPPNFLQYRLMVLGETLPNVPGRVDDYRNVPSK